MSSFCLDATFRRDSAGPTFGLVWGPVGPANESLGFGGCGASQRKLTKTAMQEPKEEDSWRSGLLGWESLGG